MKILITGATGFIGRNLIEAILNKRNETILAINSHSKIETLDNYLNECDFVYHLAAVHRPKDLTEFRKINVDYFEYILNKLSDRNIPIPVVFTSSVQAENGSDYGNSKMIGEHLLENYNKKTNNVIHILRLTNTFGRYARINHTSVVATFCYNISHKIPIIINDKDAKINLCYIDDVINELITYQEMNFSTKRMIEKKNIICTTVEQLAKDINKIANNEQPCPYIPEYHSHLTKTYKWYKGQE